MLASQEARTKYNPARVSFDVLKSKNIHFSTIQCLLSFPEILLFAQVFLLLESGSKRCCQA